MLEQIHRRTVNLGLVSALALALALQPVGSLAAEVDERADRVLRAMGDYLKAAEAFTFHAEVLVDHVLASGQKLEYSRSGDIALRRPDRLRVDVRGDLESERLWYDGTKMAHLDLGGNSYRIYPMPDNVDAALDVLSAQHGITSPVGDFLYSDPYEVLSKNLRGGYYVGLHRVRGVTTHHLAFRQEHIDWQVWIDDGVEPVPRKLVITFKKVPGSPVFRVEMSGWDFAVRLPDSAFEFLPPEEATWVE